MSTPAAPATANCFHLWYQSDQHLLGLRWLTFSSLQQVRASLMAALSQFKRHRTHRLLLDLEGMPELSAADHYWLETAYFPALAHFPMRQVALVLTSHRQHQALLESSVHQFPLDLQVFDDAATALEWLQQPAQPSPAPGLPAAPVWAAA